MANAYSKEMIDSFMCEEKEERKARKREEQQRVKGDR